MAKIIDFKTNADKRKLGNQHNRPPCGAPDSNCATNMDFTMDFSGEASARQDELMRSLTNEEWREHHHVRDIASQILELGIQGAYEAAVAYIMRASGVMGSEQKLRRFEMLGWKVTKNEKMPGEFGLALQITLRHAFTPTAGDPEETPSGESAS
jgi:hypothetical protein